MVTVGVQSLDVVMRADTVREVLGSRAWIPIPGTRQEIPGIVVWGRQAVSLIDLARFHPGMVRIERDETRPRTVIVVDSACTLAIPADRVSEVWKTHDDNIRPRQLHDFELARFEIETGEGVLPLLEPGLLLARLDVEV